MNFTFQANKQLGIRLSGNCSEPGIYIVDIQDNSAIAADGRVTVSDRKSTTNFGGDMVLLRMSEFP